MSKYKNIIFDLGGVLFNVDYHLTEQAFKKLGVSNFDQLYSQQGASHLFQRLECGTIDTADFYSELNKLSGLYLSESEIRKAWNAMLIGFRESSLQYLDTLKSKATIFLLSNTNRIHVEEIDKIYYSKPRKMPFENHFQHAFYSFNTGKRKPDSDIYQWVLNQASIHPGDTLFIDDSVQNVEGAESVGIDSVLLEKGKSIEDLGLLDIVK